MSITKEINIVIKMDEIESLEDIKIFINVMSENDLNNEEGVTYTITYDKRTN